jgi:hypothetical protein
MKLVVAFLIFASSVGVLCAQTDSTRGNWNAIARADYGFVIAHRPALEPLQEAHVKGFEISFTKQYTGTEYWQRVFLYPDFGVTCAAFDLGTDKLGTGIAVYPFVDFPLGKKRRFHFRYGMGLGYIENTFDPIDNIKNAAIGSHINGVIHFDLHYAKTFGNSLIELGPAITHFSNGSFTLPNLGINIATLNIGFQHSFGNRKPILNPEKTERDLTSQIHVYTGGFFKKIYPPGGENHFAWTLSGLWYKPVTLKSSFGAGVDAFYDNSLSTRIERYQTEKAKPIEDFRFGIYASYELSVGHLGLLFNMGGYLYNPWPNDGSVYHRIGLRYYFEKTFFCLNLKTHYARADFIELGFGVKFKTSNRK